MIDVIYLYQSKDDDLVNSYIGGDDEKGSSSKRAWRDISYKEKADSIGWSSAYTEVLADAHQHQHGSWADSMKYHLTRMENGNYQARIHSPEPFALALIRPAIRAASVTRYYLAPYDSALIEKLRTGLDRLIKRLLLADDLIENWLATHWR
ncbi:hypothetical protein [Paraburkholderia youngii]|uniref:hypothetical protein n=1 Tax=Paraburkholderia youngii TaxID=2782701 RepID=UPI003D229C91